MNTTVPPRTSSGKAQDRGQGRIVNRLMEGELLDLYAAVLIIVPIAILLRLL
ncbi:MAG: hypothetical protein PSV46_24675 [Reyranella sp.]|nr:hypothetical protein [Reyranella sp.]